MKISTPKESSCPVSYEFIVGKNRIYSLDNPDVDFSPYSLLTVRKLSMGLH